MYDDIYGVRKLIVQIGNIPEMDKMIKKGEKERKKNVHIGIS